MSAVVELNDRVSSANAIAADLMRRARRAWMVGRMAQAKADGGRPARPDAALARILLRKFLRYRRLAFFRNGAA